jgi:hypothetical protein
METKSKKVSEELFAIKDIFPNFTIPPYNTPYTEGLQEIVKFFKGE